jgi:hypothetical protein
MPKGQQSDSPRPQNQPVFGSLRADSIRRELGDRPSHEFMPSPTSAFDIEWNNFAVS